MARPRKGPAVLSRSRNIRLHHEEDQALIELAADLGQPPSRIIRRLIREAINGGPDYFQDGLLELRRMRARVGRDRRQPEPADPRRQRGAGAQRCRCASGDEYPARPGGGRPSAVLSGAPDDAEAGGCAVTPGRGRV